MIVFHTDPGPIFLAIVDEALAHAREVHLVRYPGVCVSDPPVTPPRETGNRAGMQGGRGASGPGRRQERSIWFDAVSRPARPAPRLRVEWAPMAEFREIWIERCEAARDIRQSRRMR